MSATQPNLFYYMLCYLELFALSTVPCHDLDAHPFAEIIASGSSQSGSESAKDHQNQIRSMIYYCYI